MTGLKTSKLQGFVWKTMQGWPDGKSCFSHSKPPTFGGRCNRYFWDIGLNILRLPNFNMVFQLVLTKFFKRELFSCLPNVYHVIKSCKEPITYFVIYATHAKKVMKVENLVCPLKPIPQKRSWYIDMLESQPLSTTIQQLISAPWYKTVSLYLRTMLLRFHVLLLEFCFKFECLTVLWYLSPCNHCFCGGQVLTF